MAKGPSVKMHTYLVAFLFLTTTVTAKETKTDPERPQGTDRVFAKSEASTPRRYLRQWKNCNAPDLDSQSLSTAVETESQILDVVWSKNDDTHVFLLTLGPLNVSGGRVWMSRDAGSTFKDMTTLFIRALPNDHPEEEEFVGIVSITVSKLDSRHVFFQGAGTYNWISKNGGETLRSVEAAGKTTAADHVVKLHPTNDQWALALAEREICDDPAYSFTAFCAKDLFLTTDFWGTQIWTNLTEGSDGRIAGFVDFDWGKNLHNQDTFHSERTVLATVYQSLEDLKGPYMGWDKDVHFIRSNNFFEKSDKELVPCGSQFEVVAGMIFLGVSNACPVDVHGEKREVEGSRDWLRGVTLHVSADNGHTFHEACLSVPLEQSGYSLVSTHDGEGVFLIVDHMKRVQREGFETMQYFSNVYASGDNAAVFAETLPNLRMDLVTHSVDFALIHGLPGAYVANQEANRGHGRHYMDAESFVTKVTYNGGATWERIPAPKEFRHSECMHCAADEACYLNLHGSSAWGQGVQAPSVVYSHVNAPGVLMGVGSVGTEGSLSQADCTWLSVDGGVTWTDVAVGVHIFEYGDFGGIIVMALHNSEGPTDKVSFSINEGMCWHSVMLDNAIRVQNIRMEPDGQRPRFVIHGVACHKQEHPHCSNEEQTRTPNGVVYTLDVQDRMHWPKCRDEDYEVWRPLDNKQSPCLLGASVRIEKRRRDSQCFNGGDYKRKAFPEQPCECSEDDVMCDFGFRTVGRGIEKNCHAIPKNKLPSCKLIEEGVHVVAENGKRTVHADTCTDQTNNTIRQPGDSEVLVSISSTTAHTESGSHSSLWIIGITFFAIICFGAVGLLIYRQKYMSRFSFDEEGHSISASVKKAISWIKTGFRGHVLQNQEVGGQCFVPLQ